MSGAPAALTRALPLLRCPHCRLGMSPTDAGAVCPTGHSFDRARQGYLTLLGGRGRRFPGDTVDQVLARERVQGAGLFDPVARAVAETAVQALYPDPDPVTDRDPDSDPLTDAVAGGSAVDASGPVVVDAGAGGGFYLARTLDLLTRDRTRPPLGIGTELSVPAVRRLARVHPDAAALVADTWAGLPVADGVVDLVQVVFAPRNPGEFARLLRPGGTLVVVVPGAGHLEPLRTAAGMLTVAADKSRELAGGPGTGFDTGRVRHVDVTVTVPAETARDLALMGPSGVHLDPEELTGRLRAREHEVRIHVETWSFRRLPD